MSQTRHIVDLQPGVSIHREVPAKREAGEFDLTQISSETRASFVRVCRDGGAEPADYCRVFESILGRKLVQEILK